MPSNSILFSVYCIFGRAGKNRYSAVAQTISQANIDRETELRIKTYQKKAEFLRIVCAIDEADAILYATGKKF